MSFAPIAAFEAANIVAGERFYDLRILSERGEPLTSSLGWTMNTVPLGEGRFDTLMVGSGPDLVSPSTRTVAMLRDGVPTTRRITSICIAAFTLAEAGILDGRRATTHWSYAEELGRRFPKIIVEMDRIFIADGPAWTSAGMTAGIDLALGLIERDLGQRATQRTAKVLVVHHRRRPIAAFRKAAARCEIGSRSNCIGLRKAEPSRTADGRAPCRRCPAEPATIQSRVPDGDRPFARKGNRKPAPRGREIHARARPAANRGNCPRDGIRRSRANAAQLPPSVPRPKLSATKRIRWRPSDGSAPVTALFASMTGAGFAWDQNAICGIFAGGVSDDFPTTRFPSLNWPCAP